MTGKSAICLLSLYVTRALPASVRIINGVISRLYLSVAVSRMKNCEKDFHGIVN